MSKFYVVATPIGNMGDITLRAIETFKNVDLILCEDTRQTKKLLEKYNINKPTMSYPSDDVASVKHRVFDTKLVKIFALLKEGKDLALVSDAGTPGISDPGAMLVSKIKENFNPTLRPPLSGEGWGEVDVQVIPIPGASAVITALSASGLPTHEFTFLGFLPHKKGRETLFKEIAEAKRTFVFYESPHRILKTLESLVKFCPDKKVCVARELTKIYEEFKTGSPIEVLEYFTKNKEKQRGEFTVIVA
ncbi:MAG: 16S rRNA (cytidine(1402)-2'-O)-methyltransferase [Candidatus Parcubacteria bacterium]|nr:16S rRNA (cytidine(1402)-2'-O)-methyltransferase [Candidatus Parcubacteria bacterium]